MKYLMVAFARMRSLPADVSLPRGAGAPRAALQADALGDARAALAVAGSAQARVAGCGSAVPAAHTAHEHMTHEHTTGIRAGARTTRLYHPSGPVPDPLLA
ncbi:hypothetical protein CC117_06720 [Parafrankia colletiae]|uniref:Uncharacterized protein n=1 Tax=Parafrankia colletiae TaxID=573497 RepID=A0A1S1QBZ4_9ACTN|nr:hypothetical protein [Parafrankia colletiae]MCK9899741.1 hypothetical protein [Frankia sp. Cpl3]OHV30612.1 hypothetical protein CC117_06720 [Parafrankia colletiae]